MNTTISSEVATVIDGFVQDNYMFTAFDVTKTLRNQGERVSHGNVRSAVETIFHDGEMGNYDRTVIDIGVSVSPQVYHDPSTDPSNYDKNWMANGGIQNNTPISTTAPAIPPTVAPAVPSTTSTTSTTAKKVTRNNVYKFSGAYSVEKDGRLNIPRDFVEYIGAGRSDFLYVTAGDNQGTISIHKATCAPNDYHFSYMVDKDFRIRISRTVREKLGLSGSSTEFSIKVDGDTIVVVAY